MSDIKNETELEEIKEAVEHLKTTGNFGKLLALSNAENGTNRVNQFFVNTIISLITTIESQQKEIDRLNLDKNSFMENCLAAVADVKKKNEVIESQKEEIAQKDQFNVELCKKLLDYETAHDKFVNDAFNTVKKLEKDLKESQAITELAVNRLEDIQSDGIAIEEATHAELCEFIVGLKKKVITALSEIERLQNGTPS